MNIDFWAGYGFGLVMATLISLKIVRRALAFPFVAAAFLFALVAFMIESRDKDDTLAKWYARKTGAAS